MEVQSVGSQFTFDNLITPKEEFTIFIEGASNGVCSTEEVCIFA